MASPNAGKIDRTWLAVGFVVLLAITACGMNASLALPITETPLAQVEADTTTSILAPTATQTPQPTPTPGATPTVLSATPGLQASDATVTVTPTPTWTETPTPSPTASATPSPTDTVTPAPVAATPVPSSQGADETGQTPYRYHPVGPAQPDLSQPCPGCPRAPGYITGRVVDAGGNPLPGVRLVCYNDWHRYPVVGSKGAGEYDFPILQAEATWNVVILAEADQPISPEAPVHFNPLEACWYRLDWQRID